jgi:hypothetical protein
VRIPNEAAAGVATVTVSYTSAKGKHIPPGTFQFMVK